MTLTKSINVCLKCEKTFEAGKKTAKFCSSKCRDFTVKSCDVCGNDFNSRRQDKVTTCSDACRSTKSKWPVKGSQKQCEICKQEFTVKDFRWARTCGRKCAAGLRTLEGTAGHKTTDNERQKASIRRAVLAVKRINKRYQIAIKPCAVCGEMKGWQTIGISKRCHPNTQYCKTCKPLMRMISHGISDVRTRICCVCFKPRTNDHLKTDAGMRCDSCEQKAKAMQRSQSKLLRRARKKTNGPYHSDISLIAVSVRDSDMCYICQRNVDWNDSTIGNMYPSVDHVVPLAKGGTHTWDNVKLAHRWCNSAKSDTTGDMGDIVVKGRVTEPPFTRACFSTK